MTTKVQVPTYFVIATPGRVGSAWLSMALNCHDDIFVSHGPDLNPSKDESRRGSSLRNVEYLLAEGFNFDDIDAYFDLLEAEPGFQAYGNIHGLYPRNTPYRRDYFVCTIVREPVTWIQSFIHWWLEQYRSGGASRDVLGLDEFLIEKPPFTVQLRNRLNARALPSEDDDTDTADAASEPFVWLAEQRRARYKDLVSIGKANPKRIKDVLFIKAVDTVLHYSRFFMESGTPIFRKEDVVGDLDGFQQLFKAVTENRLEFTPEYRAAIAKLGLINRNKKWKLIASLDWHYWSPWQRRYLTEEIERAGLTQFFKDLGYAL